MLYKRSHISVLNISKWCLQLQKKSTSALWTQTSVLWLFRVLSTWSSWETCIQDFLFFFIKKKQFTNSLLKLELLVHFTINQSFVCLLCGCPTSQALNSSLWMSCMDFLWCHFSVCVLCALFRRPCQDCDHLCSAEHCQQFKCKQSGCKYVIHVVCLCAKFCFEKVLDCLKALYSLLKHLCVFIIAYL